MLAPALTAMYLVAAASPAPAEAPLPVASPISLAQAPAPAPAGAEAPAPARSADADADVQAPRIAEIDAAPAKTLWLVQPLYPGQELLVPRTENAIARLLPEDARSSEIVGKRELAQALSGSEAALECIFGATRCDDPIGALVSSFGVGRVVLIKVGQEGSGYRFRVASFQPGVFEAATAESDHSNLENALLGAIVRVAPLAAAVELTSDPPGATVLVDGEKAGVTPLSTQVLPGERTIRLELPFHAPFEHSQVVPVRGRLHFAPTLEKLPGRLQVISAGATILVDGEEVGKDEVDLGTTPGQHRVRLVRSGYEPFETLVEVKPDGIAKVDQALEPTGWESFTQAMSKAQESIYSKGGYVAFVYDDVSLTDKGFGAQSTGSFKKKLDGLSAPSPSSAKVQSFGVEYGSLWRHVGMTWVGAAYFRSQDPWTFKVIESADPGETEFAGTIQGGTLRLFQPQLRLAVWRFALGVRGGLLGRVGWASGARGNNDSYAFGGVGAEVAGSLQLHIISGLYVEGGYGRSWALTGSPAGTQEIRGGIGFAY